MEKCVAVCGARQVGKTTLVRAIGEKINSVYYNLDFPDIREFLTENAYREFDKNKSKLIIIDEIQKLPSIFEIIKIIIDENPGKRGQFLITGSSQILLIKNITDTLAGRLRIFYLFPFTFQELVQKDNDLLFFNLMENPLETESILHNHYTGLEDRRRNKAILSNMLSHGSYPEMLDRTNLKDIRVWYQSYRAAYLERDIADIARIAELDNFAKCHKLTALRATQTLNYSDISKELGMSVNAIKQYTHYLIISFQIFLLQPFFMNIEKRLTKTPKSYFYDTGILRSFINNFETTNGSIYENFIISELQKLFSYHYSTEQLFFLRAHSGMEIDCIIERNDLILAIEIKLSKKITKSSVRHIKNLQKMMHKKTIGILIYPGDRIEKLYQDIYCIPDYIILS